MESPQIAPSGAPPLRLSLCSTDSGGAWLHTLGLAHALNRQRFAPELISRPVPADAAIRAQLRRAGIPHVEVRDHEELAAHLSSRAPELIHHFDSLMVIMAIDLVNEELGDRRPRSVQLLHANGRPRVPLGLADVVVGVSPSTLRWPGAEALGQRARVIDSGVERTPARSPSTRAAPTLVSISRLVPGKAVDAGLRALAELRARPWSYRIVGEGPARAQLSALAEALLGPGRAQFTGELAWPRPELEGADIFLSCSPSEGFGLAIAEAAEAGLAIVARRAGGITDAMIHGRHALLYDAPHELPGLLARALDDPALRARLGYAARTLAHARFDHAAMVAAYSRLYLELSGRTAAR